MSASTYDQVKAAADSAQAQLAAAEAQERIARDQGDYSVLLADSDGTVVGTLAEPGQVVAAGQTVVKLAHAGPREAAVYLPETVRPALRTVAKATLFGQTGETPARLRQLSDSADPDTRTFEARFVLQGRNANAPLGATVTIELPLPNASAMVGVPNAAIADRGKGPGVWVIDQNTSTVSFRPVKIGRIGQENSYVEAGVQTRRTNRRARCSFAHRGTARPCRGQRDGFPVSNFDFQAPKIEKESDSRRGFNLSALAVRERSVTLFFLLAMIIAGAFAYFKLGRAEDPSFTVKVFTVTAAWPGATAQEMQDLVAEPLEKRMQELTYYDHVDTFTRPGLAFLTVTLKDYTPPEDVQEEFYQGRKKIFDETSKLPQGVLPPVVNDEYTDVIFAVYSVEAPGLPLRLLTREAETLRQDLLHVPGVKKVNILGERPERIFVEFSYARIATLGVNARDIFDALVKQNVVTPAGSIDTQNQQVFIRLDGAFDDLQKIRDTPITAGGRTLKLSEIADVERGYEDPATFLVRHNGEPAMMLDVVMKDRFNGLDLGRALQAEQKRLQANLPAGISIAKVMDQSAIVKEAVDEFQLKFFVALLVVMIVCLISLGWRVGIVVAAAVPITLSTTLVIMLASGKDFDRISLGALILSLGLLVDDAIIAIETMVVKMEEGWDRIKAASYAWSHTAAPMLAGTLVTIIGLMPVGFAQSSAGEYCRDLFWVVCIALLTSWVVAVTFTPYLGVKLLPNIPPMEGGYAAIYETPNYQRLRRLIVWSVEHKFLVAGAVVLIFFAALFGMGLVKQQFFPNSDRPEVLVEVTLPQGSSIETTKASVIKIENWLKPQPEARIISSYIGGGAPRFFVAYNPELPDPNFAKMIILTPDAKARDKLILRLRKQVAAGLAPEARVRAIRFVFGPPSPWPIAFRVMGPDPAQVRSIADQVLAKAQGNPHVRQANEDWSERAPTAHFVLDQDRLRLIGLTSNDASQQIQFLSHGSSSDPGPRGHSHGGCRCAYFGTESSGSDKAAQHDLD